MRQAILYLKKRPVCLDLLTKVHGALMEGVRGQEKGRGRFRKVQNWIGRSGSTLETAKFVPPEPVAMMESLRNWEKHVHFDEQDRLVQLAVIHGQFEIIHPFTDGNGRVGRMMIPLVLYEQKLLSSPMFYLSAYLEQHRETYYERLLGITARGEWDEWVLFFNGGGRAGQGKHGQRPKRSLVRTDRMKIQMPEIVPTHHPSGSGRDFRSPNLQDPPSSSNDRRSLKPSAMAHSPRPPGAPRSDAVFAREAVVAPQLGCFES